MREALPLLLTLQIQLQLQLLCQTRRDSPGQSGTHWDKVGQHGTNSGTFGMLPSVNGPSPVVPPPTTDGGTCHS